MLQTRSAKRTAAAAVKIAADMVDEGTISKEEAIARIEPAPRRPAPARPVRPGRAQGRDAHRQGPQRQSPARPSGGPCSTPTRRSSGSSAARRSSSSASRPRPTTSTAWPSAQGILTARGGATSHAAVVARQIGKPCVAGCAELVVDYGAKPAHSTDSGVRVHGGRLDQPRRRDRRGLRRPRCRRSSARFEDQPDLQKVLGWADEIRRMGVWTNADKPEEAAQARSLRRRGHRPVPDRAHVPRGRAAGDRAWRDPRRQPGDPGQGQGRSRRDAERRGDRGRRDLRHGDGQARGPPAGRLRGHLRGDGRPAGRRPPHRPAAPRVPAQPRGAARQGHPGRVDRRRVGGGQGAARDDQVDARAEPDARACAAVGSG